MKLMPLPFSEENPPTAIMLMSEHLRLSTAAYIRADEADAIQDTITRAHFKNEADAHQEMANRYAQIAVVQELWAVVETLNHITIAIRQAGHRHETLSERIRRMFAWMKFT